MADNITLNSGSGGSTLKTDDDGSAHWQYFVDCRSFDANDFVDVPADFNPAENLLESRPRRTNRLPTAFAI